MSDEVDFKIIFDSVLGDELEKEECKIFASIMSLQKLSPDEVLINEGEPETTLYLLAEGKLSVSSLVEGKETVMYTMKKGECAGTRSFIDATKRKATLRAMDDCVIYTLKPKAFEELLEKHPRVVFKIMRALFRVTHSNLTRMNMESQEMSNYISKSGGRY